MGIEIHDLTDMEGGDVSCPVIVCDHCHKRITDPPMAMAAYEMWKPGGSRPTAPIFFHKATCDPDDWMPNTERLGTMELTSFMKYLEYNIYNA